MCVRRFGPACQIEDRPTEETMTGALSFYSRSWTLAQRWYHREGTSDSREDTGREESLRCYFALPKDWPEGWGEVDVAR